MTCLIWALGGLWVGAISGYFIAAMMAVAKRSDALDDQLERHYREKGEL